jgi:hypothetical protein
VLRRIFGPKRDEVTGEWRKLHNEELRNWHFSPNIIRMIKAELYGVSYSQADKYQRFIVTYSLYFQRRVIYVLKTELAGPSENILRYIL